VGSSNIILQLALWAFAAVASVLSFGFISWESHRQQRLAQRVASRERDLNSFPHPF
jgi:hypothetical protein